MKLTQKDELNDLNGEVVVVAREGDGARKLALRRSVAIDVSWCGREKWVRIKEMDREAQVKLTLERLVLSL